MTRVQILEDKKALLLAEREVLENKSNEISSREQQAISDALLPFFSEFHEDVEITVRRGGVYFKMDHPDFSYKKELFNLYLRENWKSDGITYEGVDLSYYTTQTKGVDAWELRRLRMLGNLAEIVVYHQKDIVDAVNNAVASFKEEYKAVYEEMRVIREQEGELTTQIRELKREKIREDLMGEGVTFKKDAYIQLKFNYTVRIKSIKLVDVSKSGKRATAVITFAFNESSVSREENVDVTKITDQVLARIEDIVSTSELV
jgi:hypothetical protein